MSLHGNVSNSSCNSYHTTQPRRRRCQHQVCDSGDWTKLSQTEIITFIPHEIGGLLNLLLLHMSLMTAPISREIPSIFLSLAECIEQTGSKSCELSWYYLSGDCVVETHWSKFFTDMTSYHGDCFQFDTKHRSTDTIHCHTIHWHPIYQHSFSYE